MVKSNENWRTLVVKRKSLKDNEEMREKLKQKLGKIWYKIGRGSKRENGLRENVRK